jgi:hypothetical protein
MLIISCSGMPVSVVYVFSLFPKEKSSLYDDAYSLFTPVCHWRAPKCHVFKFLPSDIPAVWLCDLLWWVHSALMYDHGNKCIRYLKKEISLVKVNLFKIEETW